MLSPDEDGAQRAVARSDLDPQDEVTTDALARSAQSGDTTSFALLAKRLRPRLLVVLSKRLGGQMADAEDVVQDTLTAAWRNLESYDANRSFTAWVYTIAIRRAVDYIRSGKRQRHYLQQLTPNETSMDTAQQLIVDREASNSIWATAKRELSNSQYTALWLRYAESLSVHEIATAMGKTQVATRVLLHRARAKLQPHFASEGRGYET